VNKKGKDAVFLLMCYLLFILFRKLKLIIILENFI